MANKTKSNAIIQAVAKALRLLTPAQRKAVNKNLKALTPAQKAVATRKRNQAKKQTVFGPQHDHRTTGGVGWGTPKIGYTITTTKTTPLPMSNLPLTLAEKRSNAAKKAAATRKANKAKTTKVVKGTSKSKKIKSGAKTIYDCLILDKSGSMSTVLRETLTGVNEYIDNIKTKTPRGVKAFVSLIQFNNGVDTSYTNSPAANVNRLTSNDYVPCGLTALNDAVALGINTLKKHLGTKAGSDSVDVTITVFTDGMENASKDYPGYKNPKLAALIQEMKDKYGWTIAFVGAGNAEEVKEIARGLNINSTNVMSYAIGGAGTTTAFNNLTSARTMKSAAYAAGTKMSANYLSK